MPDATAPNLDGAASLPALLMQPPAQPERLDFAQLTDLWQLSMPDAYEQEGLRDEAVYEAFVRPRPHQRPTLLIDTYDTERTAAKVVVLANRGGRIFDLLPLAAGGVDEATVERLFLTPAGVSFEHAAAAFGVAYRRAAGGDELRAVLADAIVAPGATVVEAMISGGGARARWAGLRERARAVRS